MPFGELGFGSDRVVRCGDCAGAARRRRGRRRGQGKVLYDTNCASCHGPTEWETPVGVALPEPKPRNFAVGEFKFDTDKGRQAGTDTDS